MEYIRHKFTDTFSRKALQVPETAPFMQRLGFEKRSLFGKVKPLTNPEDPKYLQKVRQIFPSAVFEKDLRIALDMASPQLVPIFVSQNPKQSRHDLIQFAIQMTPVVEGLYPEIIAKEPQAIASRMGYIITEVQKEVSLAHNEPLLTRAQRDNMQRDFEEELAKVSPAIQVFPSCEGQVDDGETPLSRES